MKAQTNWKQSGPNENTVHTEPR